jgi:hypothetical protein
MKEPRWLVPPPPTMAHSSLSFKSPFVLNNLICHKGGGGFLFSKIKYTFILNLCTYSNFCKICMYIDDCCLSNKIKKNYFNKNHCTSLLKDKEST